jgi:hypothetical protein
MIMSSNEFAEWRAYDRINPFGERRADLRAGVVAAVVANANRGKRRKAFRPEDFMPTFEDQSTEAKTSDELLHKVEMLNAAFRGKDKRKKI